VRFITGALSGAGRPDRVILPADLPLLETAMADRELLYLDSSLNDFAERGIRQGDDIAIRELLGGLGDLALRLNLPVLASRHNRKGGSRDPLEYGSGTVGTVAKSRSVLGVYRDPKDPEVRLFAKVKCNLAPGRVATLRARFTSDTEDAPLRVDWLGTDPRTARDILADLAQANAGTLRDPSRPRRALRDWLQDGTWKAVSGLRDLAEAADIGWKGVENAKRFLGILHERRGDAGMCWRDPWANTRCDETGPPGGESLGEE
jgi:hypothetical protein